jgi:hypothetical protein
MTRSGKGAKISAAKKGVRQLELAPGELTLTEAWREFKVGRAVLRDGAESGKLRHRRVERPGNQPDAIVFDRGQLREDFAKWPCSYPGCDQPAPGKSGRCGEHAARGEPSVELVCQYEPCGKTFVRPVSWLREREGRGHYCSNECKGLAHAAANPDLGELNKDGARDHHRKIAQTIVAEGLLDRRSWTAAHPFRYSPSQITARAQAGELPSDLRVYDGSVRRVIARADLAADRPPWADQLDRRAGFARARHGDDASSRIYGRLNFQRAAEHGTTVGRPAALSEAEVAIARRLRADGLGYRRIAQKLNSIRTLDAHVSHVAVKRALDRASA